MHNTESEARTATASPDNEHLPAPPTKRSQTGVSVSSDRMPSKPSSYFEGDPVAALWYAVFRGLHAEARIAIQSGADACQSKKFDTNDLRGDVETSTATRLRQPKKFEGSMVSAAVMRGDIEMVRLLVEEGQAELSGPRSYYKFDAGLRNVELVAPPSFAVCIKGDVNMMKELVRLGANFLEKASMDRVSKTTLLWNVSYSGHVRCVKYLLLHTPCGEQMEESCAHQDDGIFSTPLHIASLGGHVQVVQLLLKEKAKVYTRNEAKMTPLTDAIDRDHAEVVKVLVRHNADIFAKDAHEALFRKNNMVTIAAAASGLYASMKDDPSKFHRNYIQVKGPGLQPRLNADRVVSFFNTPGDATMYMINVIFQKRNLAHTTQRMTDDGQKVRGRRLYKNAHIPPGSKFNAALGPDAEYFHRQLEASRPPDNRHSGVDMNNEEPARVQELDEAKSHLYDTGEQMSIKDRHFFKTLTPQEDYHYHVKQKGKAQTPMQVPIDIFQCVLPNIHTDEKVLFAIMEQEGDAAFKALGIRAILELAWRGIKWRYTLHLFNSILLVMCFMWTTWRINNRKDAFDNWDRLRVTLMTLFWFKGMWQEITQVIGYWLLKKLDGYLRDFWNLVDWVRLVLTAIVLILLVSNHDAFMDDTEVEDGADLYRRNRVLLSFVVFFRWMRVLYGIKGYTFAGPDMLPILRALGNVIPFLAVVVCPLMGFFHAYYCFGVYGDDLFRTLSIVFRLGFIGDFDVEDMEDVDGQWTATMVGPGKELTLDFNDPVDLGKGRWWAAVRLFIMACSTILTVAMMNIFIGVLSESYNQARQAQEEIFWKSRAQIVFSEQAGRLAEQKIIACFCCRREKKIHPEESDIGSLSQCTDMDSNEKDDETHNSDINRRDYVWYCTAAEGVSSATDGSLDDSSAPVTQKDFEELKEMNNLLRKQNHSILEFLHRVHGHHAERHHQDALRSTLVTPPGLVVQPHSEPDHSASRLQDMVAHGPTMPAGDTSTVHFGSEAASKSTIATDGPHPAAARPESQDVSILGLEKKACSRPVIEKMQHAQQAATHVAESAWAAVERPLLNAQEVVKKW